MRKHHCYVCHEEIAPIHHEIVVEQLSYLFGIDEVEDVRVPACEECYREFNDVSLDDLFDEVASW